MYQHGTRPCGWCASGTLRLVINLFIYFSILHPKGSQKAGNTEPSCPSGRSVTFTYRFSLFYVWFLKDPPRGEEEWIPSDPRFTRAADLVSYIRSVPDYSSWFCIGVAGTDFCLRLPSSPLTFIVSRLSWRSCRYFYRWRHWDWQTQD